MQGYVHARLTEANGSSVKPITVKKEVATFRFLWNWAVSHGHLAGPAPTKGLRYPKSDQQHPFMTWTEIETVISRGGLSEDEEKELWAALFLTKEQVEEILDHVKANALHPQIYPMILFAAHTGARCSEILRSRIDDFDFQSRTVRIREKKKTQKKAITFRHVPMTDLVAEVFGDWFSRHPGGQFTIVNEKGEMLSQEKARHHFNQTMLRSKWERVRGYHVFRHSFASNLAAAGVDQRIIDEWMGHQTEEMRKRYRHLFPEQQREVIRRVFGRSEPER